MKLFYRVSEVVRDRLRGIGIQGSVAEKTAAYLWPKVVGEKTAEATRVDRVRDGIVYVTCADSIWAQELHFLKNIIIDKLNEQLEVPVIKDIVLSGRGFGRKAVKPSEEKGNNYPPRSLNEEEVKKVDEAVRVIEDKELAEAVRRGILAALSARVGRDEEKNS